MLMLMLMSLWLGYYGRPILLAAQESQGRNLALRSEVHWVPCLRRHSGRPELRRVSPLALMSLRFGCCSELGLMRLAPRR
jgi:hypothetical protein